MQNSAKNSLFEKNVKWSLKINCDNIILMWGFKLFCKLLKQENKILQRP